jgi:hypothetical protein
MTTVKITGVQEVQKMLEKYRLEVRCENCNNWHKRGAEHVCPEIIDAVFVEDRPQLPTPKTGERFDA